MYSAMDNAPPAQSILETLRTVEFRLGLKGYNVDEVDEYLEKAAVEAEGLHEQLRQMTERLRQASERIAPARGARRPPTIRRRPGVRVDSPRRADDSLQQTLILAQRFVDQTKRETEAEAAGIVAQAEERARLDPGRGRGRGPPADRRLRAAPARGGEPARGHAGPAGHRRREHGPAPRVRAQPAADHPLRGPEVGRGERPAGRVADGPAAPQPPMPPARRRPAGSDNPSGQHPETTSDEAPAAEILNGEAQRRPRPGGGTPSRPEPGPPAAVLNRPSRWASGPPADIARPWCRPVSSPPPVALRARRRRRRPFGRRGGRHDPSEEGDRAAAGGPAGGQATNAAEPKATQAGQERAQDRPRRRRPSRRAAGHQAAGRQDGPGHQGGGHQGPGTEGGRPRPPATKAPTARTVAGQDDDGRPSRPRPRSRPRSARTRGHQVPGGAAQLLHQSAPSTRSRPTDLKAEADSLAQEREPGDVQFDEESGEGGTVTVDRERDLALSAQALPAVEEIDDALRADRPRRPTAPASAATSRSSSPGCGPCRTPGSAWPARAGGCRGAEPSRGRGRHVATSRPEHLRHRGVALGVAAVVVAADQVTKSLAESHLHQPDARRRPLRPGPRLQLGLRLQPLHRRAGRGRRGRRGRSSACSGVVAWRTPARPRAVALGPGPRRGAGQSGRPAVPGPPRRGGRLHHLTHWPTFNVADACITVGACAGAPRRPGRTPVGSRRRRRS